MRKIITKIFILVTLAVFLLPAVSVFAEDGYTMLAPLPGLPDKITDKNILGVYIPVIFNLAIGISAVATVLMIVIGGFQYITSDAIMKKQQGKERIKNAVISLVLVIGAWLILNEINPNLLNINLNIDSAQTTSATSNVSGGTLTPNQIAESNTIRATLESKGVLTYAPPCTAGETSRCVNLNGLKSSTINGLEKLAQELCPGGGACISITGGTEAGHSTTGSHPKGEAVDFGFKQTQNGKIINYLTKQISNGEATSQNTKDGELITITKGPISGTTFLKEGDHWHVVFK